MQNFFSSPSGLLIGILLFILFLLVLREILTWYWKFTRMVELLERIERNTRSSGPSASEEFKKKPATLSGVISKGSLPGEEIAEEENS